MKSLSIRKATIEDAIFLFNLRNSETNRAQFKNSDKVELSQHLIWLKKMLEDDEFKIYIASLDGNDIGQFRVDKSGDVSVSLLDSYKGLKLSHQLILIGSKHYLQLYKKDLYASIKINNFASQKSFEKAGYIFLDQRNCENDLYNRYILKSESDE